ncbi:MAG: hypothetical protein HZA34_02200 [Candidatus Pacebacteria bacterium]|nr:hypothetical protein [Candidatus Paceibacterota bacterium]
MPNFDTLQPEKVAAITKAIKNKNTAYLNDGDGDLFIAVLRGEIELPDVSSAFITTAREWYQSLTS